MNNLRRRDSQRLNPFCELDQLEKSLSQLFDLHFQDSGVTVSDWTPRINIAEKDETVYLQADLPGVNKDDIELKYEQGILTLKGTRQAQAQESDDKKYFHVEVSSGSFQRSIRLPYEIESAKIKAEFTNGVLEVELPKAEKSKARKIAIDN